VKSAASSHRTLIRGRQAGCGGGAAARTAGPPRPPRQPSRTAHPGTSGAGSRSRAPARLPSGAPPGGVPRGRCRRLARTGNKLTGLEGATQRTIVGDRDGRRVSLVRELAGLQLQLHPLRERAHSRVKLCTAERQAAPLSRQALPSLAAHAWSITHITSRPPSCLLVACIHIEGARQLNEGAAVMSHPTQHGCQSHGLACRVQLAAIRAFRGCHRTERPRWHGLSAAQLLWKAAARLVLLLLLQSAPPGCTASDPEWGADGLRRKHCSQQRPWRSQTPHCLLGSLPRLAGEAGALQVL